MQRGYTSQLSAKSRVKCLGTPLQPQVLEPVLTSICAYMNSMRFTPFEANGKKCELPVRFCPGIIKRDDRAPWVARLANPAFAEGIEQIKPTTVAKGMEYHILAVSCSLRTITRSLTVLSTSDETAFCSAVFLRWAADLRVKTWHKPRNQKLTTRRHYQMTTALYVN